MTHSPLTFSTPKTSIIRNIMDSTIEREMTGFYSTAKILTWNLDFGALGL